MPDCDRYAIAHLKDVFRRPVMDLRSAAKHALQVQDACNLSGVVHGFADAINAVSEESHRLQKGSHWVATHPITILFLSKLTDLARVDCEAPGHHVWAAVQTLAESDPGPVTESVARTG